MLASIFQEQIPGTLVPWCNPNQLLVLNVNPPMARDGPARGVPCASLVPLSRMATNLSSPVGMVAVNQTFLILGGLLCVCPERSWSASWKKSEIESNLAIYVYMCVYIYIQYISFALVPHFWDTFLGASHLVNILYPPCYRTRGLHGLYMNHQPTSHGFTR